MSWDTKTSDRGGEGFLESLVRRFRERLLRQARRPFIKTNRTYYVHELYRAKQKTLTFAHFRQQISTWWDPYPPTVYGRAHIQAGKNIIREEKIVAQTIC